MTPDDDACVQITAVLCTYNRAERVERAVRAILDQSGCTFEVVVVDDGSSDATPAVLAAIGDPRLRVVRRRNGGLSSARNSGAAAASGRWVVFIDDDDLARPGWLAGLVAQAADPSVGIATCGARFVTPDGAVHGIQHPARLGEPFGTAFGSTLAGTFAVRADLLRAAGGYLDGLATRHQTELFIRLLAVAREHGVRMESVDEALVDIELRPATERPSVNPRRLYDGTRWILARHPGAFAGNRGAASRFEAVVATNAARLGEWPAARRRFVRAVRAQPRSPAMWGRLALSVVPVAAARVWSRHGEWARYRAGEVGILRQSADDLAAPGHADRELFLAWRYRENPPAPSSAAGPDPVRARAARVVRHHRWAPVVTVSCRAGGELAVSGDHAVPGVVVCLDAIHRVDDPVRLLHRLAGLAGDAPLLLSTPDLARADPTRPAGPPSDPTHRREWTADQLELLLLSTGWAVERTWHVRPAGTSPVAGLARSGRSTALVLARRRAR